jgi:hypothetical protein
MKFAELLEQGGTIGTAAPAVAPAAGANLTGNTGALNDPRMQAAQLAQQRQQKQQARQAIMQQIAALNKQLADLNRTT